MKSRLITTFGLCGALALAGCSSSGPTSTTGTPAPASSTPPTTSAASAPSSSSSSSTSASSASTSTSASASAAGSAEELGDRMAKAIVNAKSGKGKATASGSATLDLSMEFVFVDPTRMDMHATMATSGMNLEMVVKGGTFYMKGLPTAATGGKPWIKADPNGTDAFSKQMSGQLQSLGDPRQITKSFSGATAKLVGEEGGLRHYTVTGARGVETIEVYVDKQDRPTKFVVTASGVTANAEYSDWGTPVTITEPPADQVGSFQTGK